MSVIVIDTGAETAVTFDTTATDPRSAMLTAASAIAAFVIDTEGKLAATAKDWGCNLFRAVYSDGATAKLDDLIGDSKVAAGWAILTTTETGKKAKARMEVYFSNARLVAERWGTLDDAGKAAVLAGTSSIHYLAGQFRKADADAKKAAKKAADTAAAEAAKLAEPAAPVSLADMLAGLLLAIDAASDDELSAIHDDISAVVAAYDNRVNAAADREAIAA